MGKIVTFQKRGRGRTGFRQRKCMKMWRLGKKQSWKWRPNSLDPSSFLFFFFFVLTLCLLFLSGFLSRLSGHVLVKKEVNILCTSRAWTELVPHNQLLLVCSGLGTRWNRHRWPDGARH